MFSLLWEAIIGLIVGALAKFIMPGKDPGGIFITMLIGVAGALLATFIGSHVGLYQEGQRAGFFMSLVGAIMLLAIYRLIKGNDGHHLADPVAAVPTSQGLPFHLRASRPIHWLDRLRKNSVLYQGTTLVVP